jgi:DNA-binding CsgD family transcriptional regulator
VVPVHLERVWDGNDVGGVVVHFLCPSPTTEASVPRGPLHRRTFGWDSLTKAEHSVIDLVADGLTNRQIANTLWRSPYTVDAHLRHIFQKLGIHSRVELVRIAFERTFAAPRSLDGGVAA